MIGPQLRADTFRTARDQLLALRADYPAARELFRWPTIPDFNWVRDWFDVVARNNSRPALRVLEPGRVRDVSFAQLSAGSDRMIARLAALGLRRGDRLMVCLDPSPILWGIMLAAMKSGVVLVPTPRGLPAAELLRRLTLTGSTAFIATTDELGKMAQLGPRRPVCRTPQSLSEQVSSADPAHSHAESEDIGGSDPLMIYFTSGTTSDPKMVEHSHTSYPIGHLSSLYGSGLLPGDVHLNIADPGWAKHSWSSLFVPWTAEATVVVAGRALASGVDGADIISTLLRSDANSLCAPPRIWRALARLEPAPGSRQLREATSAGESLDAETVVAIERRWGVEVRDVYGQTETTAILANLPGGHARPGTAGLPLPGYQVVITAVDGAPAAEGELCLRLDPEFPAIMSSAGRSSSGLYRTGDLARRDSDGFITILGRIDDVFKTAGHRVSPAEIESVLQSAVEVAEAAAVGIHHPADGAVPHAFVRLLPGVPPTQELRQALLRHAAARLPPHAVPRRVAFVDEFPRTPSGKVRRQELGSATGSIRTVSTLFAVNTKESTMGTRTDLTTIKNVFRSGFEQTDLPWNAWVEPGREGVEYHVLWAPDPDGSAGLLLRFQPGAHGDFHRHLGWELMLVLDGVLRNDDGEEYPPGTLVVEHPDSIHQMSSDTGCTVLAVRTQPAKALA